MARRLTGMGNKLQAIPQPLHRRSGNKNTALNRIAKLTIKSIRHRCQQAILRPERLVAGVQHEKAASAVGALGHTRLEASLPDESGVLIPGNAGNRDCRSKPLGPRSEER